jgi:histidine triad (HIT) family protein
LSVERQGDCIFCQIIAGEMPGEVLYRDEQVTAFRDIHPVAPTHVLIVPNRHVASVSELRPEDEPLVGHLFTVADQVARQEGIRDRGYRLIINNGEDGRQVIFHLHLHLIGGHRMRFPMG